MVSITKRKKNTIDMLNGPLVSKLLLFAIPVAVSSVLQQLFNSVDIAVIGQFSTPQALAAVGSNGSLINLTVNIFVGMSVGANVLISRYIGQSNTEGIKRAIPTAISIALISGFFLLILGVLAARSILEAMDTPTDVIDLSVTYLQIYFLGMPAAMTYNFGASILRSMGDTRRPLYCLMVGGIANILINLLLVIEFNMDVAGVAIGTVIGNIIASLLVINILRKETYPFRLSKLTLSAKEISMIMKIGIPAGIQGLVFSTANVFIQTVINGYGSMAVAGSAAALNYEHFCFFIITAFGSAATTFTGQNYGAGLGKRCRMVFIHSMWLSVVGCAFFNLLFVWQEQYAIGLFTSEQEVFKFAFIRMETVVTWQWIANSYEIASASLRGIGYSLLPALLTVFGTCMLRLCWIFFYCPTHYGYKTLLSVYPISWVVTGIIVLIAHYCVFRNLKIKQI